MRKLCGKRGTAAEKPTAVDCWDNPITAGAYSACLDRDIESRLDRYSRDEDITDVWIWAQTRSDREL